MILNSRVSAQDIHVLIKIRPNRILLLAAHYSMDLSDKLQSDKQDS